MIKEDKRKYNGGKRKGAGRKSFNEEQLTKAIERKAEDIAKSIIIKRLKHADSKDIPDFEDTKSIALPIQLKTMKDQSEVDLKMTKPLLGGNSNTEDNNDIDTTQED